MVQTEPCPICFAGSSSRSWRRSSSCCPPSPACTPTGSGSARPATRRSSSPRSRRAGWSWAGALAVAFVLLVGNFRVALRHVDAVAGRYGCPARHAGGAAERRTGFAARHGGGGGRRICRWRVRPRPLAERAVLAASRQRSAIPTRCSARTSAFYVFTLPCMTARFVAAGAARGLPASQHRIYTSAAAWGVTAVAPACSRCRGRAAIWRCSRRRAFLLCSRSSGWSRPRLTSPPSGSIFGASYADIAVRIPAARVLLRRRAASAPCSSLVSRAPKLRPVLAAISLYVADRGRRPIIVGAVSSGSSSAPNEQVARDAVHRLQHRRDAQGLRARSTSRSASSPATRR